MIASKPESASSQGLRQHESGGLPLNIFAGLSFPEVPKHAINHIASSVPDHATTNLSEAELKPSDDSLLINEVKNKQEYRSEETTVNHRIVHSAQSLASLYSTSEAHTSESYPQLPVSIVSMTYNNTHRYDLPETGSIRIAEPTPVSIIIEPPPSESSCPHDEQKSGENTLVTDLITENARLSSELEGLRKSLGERFPSTQTAPRVESMVPSSSNGVSMQQEGMIRGERDEENHGLLQAQTDSNKEGIKYVCCGSCRTWLSAPASAMFVRCPGCESVNNCEQLVRTPFISCFLI
jgi:LSD1 subclass zinc finger protein